MNVFYALCALVNGFSSGGFYVLAIVGGRDFRRCALFSVIWAAFALISLALSS